MRQIEERLDERDWRLRTGGADGADNAFAAAPPDRRDVIVPWRGYNGWQGSACRVLTPKEIGCMPRSRNSTIPHGSAARRRCGTFTPATSSSCREPI